MNPSMILGGGRSVPRLRVGGGLRGRCSRPRRPQKGPICGAHKIALLPGDGIGPEISNVAVALLKAVGSQTGDEFIIKEADFGGIAIDKKGEALPAETLAICRESDAVLLAAIGGDKWNTLPATERPERGLLNLRSSLGTFANLRPAVVLPQLAGASSLREDVVSGVDIMIVRELNGGIYYGQPRGVEKSENGERVGINTMIYSESEIERIAVVAFEMAMKRSKRLCSVGKANVLEVWRLWEEVVNRVAQRYPDVALEHMYVDNACMQLISRPKYFDTMVTDGAAALTGSLGMLPSASLSDKGLGIYEPVHGSAPTIAGMDKANPLAMVFSTSMMCRYGLNLPDVATTIDEAVSRVLEQGFRTEDIKSDGTKVVSCSEMGECLLQQVAAPTTGS